MFRWLVNTMIASMIFFPVREFSMTPESAGLQAEDVWCETQDGIQIHGWWIEARSSDTCLLFFHGNADNISSRLPKAKEWVARGVSVFLVDYRGYGKSKGEVKTGNDLLRDGEAALQWLSEKKGFKHSQIILYGESIGAVPAIDLGCNNQLRAIILEAPFTSVKELAKKHYGIAPDILLKDFLMDNESLIAKLRSPLFILHGTEDEIVPFEMGKALFEKAPNPKQFFAIEGARHNDIDSVGGDEFFERPFQFAKNPPV